MTPGLLDIGEVAARTGLPPSTLRYYEAAGLIESVGRRGLRRLFDANVLGLLDFIALGQRAGFSLDEIGAMMTPDGSMTLDREQLLERADALDQRIRELTAVRDGLRHAADCPAPSHLECPKFLRLLRVAGSRRARARRTGGQGAAIPAAGLRRRGGIPRAGR